MWSVVALIDMTARLGWNTNGIQYPIVQQMARIGQALGIFNKRNANQSNVDKRGAGVGPGTSCWSPPPVERSDAPDQIINRAPSGAARQISSLLRQPVEMIHRPKECCLEQPACWELGTIYIWNLQTLSGLIHVQLKYVKTIRYTYTSGKQQERFFLSLRVWPCVLSVTYRYDFLKYGHVRLQSLYLQVNRFSVILDLPHWFRQYECLV